MLGMRRVLDIRFPHARNINVNHRNERTALSSFLVTSFVAAVNGVVALILRG